MRKLLSTTAVLALLASPFGLPAADAYAKSEWSASGVGKDGTPPGKSKGDGENARSHAPGQNKADKPDRGDDDDDDDSDDDTDEDEGDDGGS